MRTVWQVVVGACVEPGHPLGDRVARGEHEDRQVVSRTAQSPAHFEPVDARHHDVEHHRVRSGCSDLLECVVPVERQVDGVSVEAE